MLIGKAISPFALKKKLSGGGGGTDADAQAFITATGITGTNATATNQLVLDLKAANIWTKMKAVYPIVGGTATAHKFNLKNPLDTDAAFRLVFNGGWTHSANGALPNGTNAYANTYLTPSTNLTLSSLHISHYSRTTTVGTSVEIGGNGNLSSFLHLRVAANFVSGSGAATLTAFTTTTDARGFWFGSKRAANDRVVFRNGVKQNSNTTSDSGALDSLPLYLAAQNNVGSAALFSAKEIAFASIGDGLSDADALALYNAVNAFQVSLGRNV